MKKLVVLLLATLVATSAFAVIDPDPDMVGIYFDTTADNNCFMTGPSVPFFAYFIATNPVPGAINAYEFGFNNAVPAGMEGMLFMLASNIGNGADGVDVGTHDPLGGDYIVGLAAPIATTEATVLHSWQYMLLAEIPVEMFIFQSSKPSIEGVYPVLQNSEGSVLYQAGQSTGGPDVPVATVNLDCVIGVEDASFGSVKSLFR
jgi:hypothetical protein